MSVVEPQAAEKPKKASAAATGMEVTMFFTFWGAQGHQEGRPHWAELLRAYAGAAESDFTLFI
ncbi:MAG: hypothetical protein H0Z38_04345 [Firmicutes bacterium]|nr:hypothetical protein [Bacillota bacterium]